MLILLKWVIIGITTTVAGLALRFLWQHLKDQRDRLLEAYWRPAKVGLLVFAIWILWELLWFFMMGTDDKIDWLNELKCAPPFAESHTWSGCRFKAHMAYFFLVLLPLSIPKAAVVGILAAILLIIDPVVIRILTVARGDTGTEKTPKQTLKERIGISIKSTRVSISNKRRGIANGIRSTRDSVSNMGKKVARFRPWKIFGKRKSKNQPVPSAEENQPANEPHEQMDAVVQGAVVTEKGKPGEKNDNGGPSITAETDDGKKEETPPQNPLPEKEESKIENIATSVGTAIGSTAKSAKTTIDSTAKAAGNIATSAGATIGSTAKSAGTTIGSKVKAVGHAATSTRDSVSNMGKKVARFRPGNIFRRRKKDNPPAPSAEKKPPADDPKEQ